MSNYFRIAQLSALAAVLGASTFFSCYKPESNKLTPETPKIETTVERTNLGVNIIGLEYTDSIANYSKEICVHYFVQNNQLYITVLSEGNLTMFADDANDGLVDRLQTYKETIYRAGNEMNFQANVDTVFNKYKHLLNADELIKQELAKPAPK